MCVWGGGGGGGGGGYHFASKASTFSNQDITSQNTLSMVSLSPSAAQTFSSL